MWPLRLSILCVGSPAPSPSEAASLSGPDWLRVRSSCLGFQALGCRACVSVCSVCFPHCDKSLRHNNSERKGSVPSLKEFRSGTQKLWRNSDRWPAHCLAGWEALALLFYYFKCFFFLFLKTWTPGLAHLPQYRNLAGLKITETLLLLPPKALKQKACTPTSGWTDLLVLCVCACKCVCVHSAHRSQQGIPRYPGIGVTV